jgi:putative SOS response-associated peptidase YedK
MCYSNSSTSTNVALAARYKKTVPPAIPATPLFYASGFSHPKWRIITHQASLEYMQWGLVPTWFKDPSFQAISSKTLNARLETLNEKASFKHLVSRNHCIVPSTGFFEWQTNGNVKRPYFIFPANTAEFSMAGLYDQWLNPLTGETLLSFTILTTEANDLMCSIHNTKKRMPILLQPDQEENWLHMKIEPKEIKLLPEKEMNAHEIDRRIINGTTPNHASVQLPFTNPIAIQGSLFD